MFRFRVNHGLVCYNKFKEYNNLQPGEIVCLYDKGPASSWTGTVLVSTTNDPGILLDLPEGTRALLVQIPEPEPDVDYDQVVEIFVDGISGYVHLANCFAL